MGSIPLRIRFDKMDGFIKICNGIKSLLMLAHNGFMKFLIVLNTLQVKKVVLKIVLIIILEESELSL